MCVTVSFNSLVRLVPYDITRLIFIQLNTRPSHGRFSTNEKHSHKMCDYIYILTFCQQSWQPARSKLVFGQF